MINTIIQSARAQGCSDIHLTVGDSPVFRKNGSLFRDPKFATDEMQAMIEWLVPSSLQSQFAQGVDSDFCYVSPDGTRQRVNVYREQGHLCAAIRLLNDQIPTLEQLQLPTALRMLASKPNGLVLVTGPTGSGKSTTLAAMIDHINSTRNCHIITMEDPVEYLHTQKQALIHQREIGVDATSFASALRSSLREDPDVILVGEMRDLETISAAITAAETGHLVLSTLHTTGAANTLDRIIDVFPAGDKEQVRAQLSTVLRGVVTQQLVPRADGMGRCAAFEILLSNDAVANMIRENKCFQIGSVLQTSIKDGMCSLGYDLAQLVLQGKISLTDAMEKTNDKPALMRYLQ